MLKISMLPFFLTLLAAAPADSSNVANTRQDSVAGSPVAASAAAKPAASADKKICKQLPNSTSRITERACLTASEWKQVEADLKE